MCVCGWARGSVGECVEQRMKAEVQVGTEVREKTSGNSPPAPAWTLWSKNKTGGSRKRCTSWPFFFGNIFFRNICNCTGCLYLCHKVHSTFLPLFVSPNHPLPTTQVFNICCWDIFNIEQECGSPYVLLFKFVLVLYHLFYDQCLVLNWMCMC